MSPIEKPSCPACGTPSSMIEDGYAIDLVPWWKYLWQRFNPWRLVFPWPKPEARWIPVGQKDADIQNHEQVVFLFPATKFSTAKTITFPREQAMAASQQLLDLATHWYPLPPLP